MKNTKPKNKVGEDYGYCGKCGRDLNELENREYDEIYFGIWGYVCWECKSNLDKEVNEE